MRERILVADDEECIRYAFSTFLHEAGFSVETATSLSDCLNKLEAATFDLLFLDVGFGCEDGLDALRDIVSQHQGCPVVIITGNPSPKSMIKARHLGAKDYIVKPVHKASLLYVAQKTLAQAMEG